MYTIETNTNIAMHTSENVKIEKENPWMLKSGL